MEVETDLEISLTVDINTTIYDLRTQINKFLGVKAYYQLILLIIELC